MFDIPTASPPLVGQISQTRKASFRVWLILRFFVIHLTGFADLSTGRHLFLSCF